MQISAILLAAGEAKRFGSNKLLYEFNGKPLIEHALSALQETSLISEIIVVVNSLFGKHQSDLNSPYARRLEPYAPTCIVVNSHYRDGMGTSLSAGVKASASTAQAYLIALADMPFVSTGLITSLIACYHQTPKKIVVPLCLGRRGHPVIIPAEHRESLISLTGDEGARRIIADHPEDVRFFETDDNAVLKDVDSIDDV